MKAILITDYARWCALMMNGDKTIEIRKENVGKAVQKLIDEYGYADIYVYCTKDIKNGLYRAKKWVCVNQKNTIPSIRNGKVPFKFRCYKVEEIRFDDKEIQRKACLTEDELFDYLFVNEPYHEDMKKGYAWHISNLVIFDKPKELSEFYLYCKDEKCEYRNNHCSICYRTPLTKAPQSWCYVEIDE